jgi:hypothetical protein
MWWYSHSSVRAIGLIDSLQRQPGWRTIGLAEGPALQLHHRQPR